MKNRKYVTVSVPDSLQKAKEVEAKIKSELVSDEYYNRRKASITLNEIWERYLESYKARGKAWKVEERRYNQYLKPKFGKRVLSDISPFDIQSIGVTLSKTETKYGTPYRPKTIKNIIDLLSVLFNYAINMDLFEKRNPCEKVKRPKINNEVTNTLSVDKLKKFLVFLDKYNHRPTANLLKFLLFTGIRLGEAFKLAYKDINLEDGTMVLRDPKGGKDQWLCLNELAIGVIQDQKNFKNSSIDLVFPNQEGRIRTEIGDRWVSIKKAVGIPLNFRCHDLRHQFATLLASSGKVDPYTIQRLMTHKDFKTTQRYAHLYEQTMRDGVKVIDELLKNYKSSLPVTDLDNSDSVA